MMLPQKGGCLCSALRYEIYQPPVAMYACHCTVCQRQTGSAFSLAAVVAGGAFHLTGADPRPIQRTADSDRVITGWVCPDCGTLICGGPKPGSAPLPEFRVVRGGTLDDTSWLRPTFHFWTRSKQPWITMLLEGRSFETQPADYLAVLTGKPS
jgi:hypothetical protein